MNPTKQAYEKTANTIIGWLERRNMEGYYFETAKEAVDAILSQISEGSKVTWAGSMTFLESGMKAALENGNYELIDRDIAKTPEETSEMYARQVLSDYCFMSTNAITLKGELVNIDARSNRVSLLCFGPKNIILLVGMNKVVADVESGIKRIRTKACPPNCIRLNKNTPCSISGVCGECLSDDSLCNNIVITRHSSYKGRIKIYLIGEELGF